jgi:hypothetical protein
MKIQTKNELGLLYNSTPAIAERFREQHTNYLKQVLNPTSEEEFKTQLANNLRFGVVGVLDRISNKTDYKNFIITDTAKEIAGTIKIGEKFNYKLLNTIKPQRSTYLLGETRFVRFEITDGNIFIFYVQTTKPLHEGNVEIYYRMFRIDTFLGTINMQDDVSPDVRQEMMNVAEELIRLLIFINLSDVEFIHLPPSRKVGTRKSGSFKNDTKLNITVVDSSWNKFIIRTEEFNVKGHLRLQACGVNFSERKLTWINPYKKEGYVRKPKKNI